MTEQTKQTQAEIAAEDENHIIAERRAKLAALPTPTTSSAPIFSVTCVQSGATPRKKTSKPQRPPSPSPDA